MNIEILAFSVLLVALAIFIICIFYLIYLYKKLLDKYTKVTIKTAEGELNRKIQVETNNYVSKKVDLAVEKASEEAAFIITKNANNVANSLKRKTVEKLIEDQKGEEQAVVADFEEARTQIEQFKQQEFERLRKNANSVLETVTKDVLPNLIDSKTQDGLIIKSLENAKRQNLL